MRSPSTSGAAEEAPWCRFELGRGGAFRSRSEGDAPATQILEFVPEAGCNAPILHLGNDDDCTGCEAHKLLGDTAKQQPGQLAATAPAYHYHLDRAAPGNIDQ